MDRRERNPSLLVAIRAALEGFQATVWTALPAFVDSFNAARQTVSAQPTIQAQYRAPTGETWQNTTLPLCVDCPVLFPGGGGFTLTFPIAAGDEGLLVFSSRCIDQWWQSGGVQPQAELRMHDLSDGFFIPTGGMSNAKVPGGISTTTTQLRSVDGECYVELAAGHAVNVVAPGGVKITGNLVVTGSLGADVITDSDGTVTLNNHTHSGVQSGGDDSGPPVPGT